MAALRWAVAASSLLWLHAHWPVVPGVLQWLACVVEGAALAMAVVYAVLEHRWARLAARLRPDSPGVVLHLPWTTGDDVRSALWYGLAALSALPWMAVAGGRALPRPVLSLSTLAAFIIGGLVALAEMNAYRRGAGPRGTLEERAVHDRYRNRVALLFLCAVTVAAGLAAGAWMLNAVRHIEAAESDRDRWQTPEGILQALSVADGAVVADLGCGVGYFALKLSDRVGERGEVLAVDGRRLPLLLLRVRALLRRRRNLTALHGDAAEADLPAGRVDAVLLANTYHELADPQAVLAHAFAALRPGGRLVVVDPADGGEDAAGASAAHHHEPAASAAGRLRRTGFELVRHEERFIDAPGGPWWLVVARKP